jgi:hypothetical protein
MGAVDRRRPDRAFGRNDVSGHSGSPFGDFLRAVHALDASMDAGAREALAALFELEVRPAGPPTPTGGLSIVPPVVPPPVVPPPPIPEHPPSPTPIPATARALEVTDSERPVWVRSASVLFTRSPRRVPPKPSLLEPHWTRAILTTALSTPGEAGDIDVDRLVDDVASGRPVRALPLLRAATLARGVYCWIDRSPSLQPFVEDQIQIAAQLRHVVGPSRLTVRTTNGVPPRSAEAMAGVPHLVLSDLGAVSVAGEPPPDSPDAWADWAEWVGAELGGTVVALVPARVSGYPDRLRRVVRLLPWDRATSVQTVRRALG